MKIFKIATENIGSSRMADIYEGLKKAIEHLSRGNTGKAKNEIKDAIKGLEEIRPHLKYKDRPLRGKWI